MFQVQLYFSEANATRGGQFTLKSGLHLYQAKGSQVTPGLQLYFTEANAIWVGDLLRILDFISTKRSQENPKASTNPGGQFSLKSVLHSTKRSQGNPRASINRNGPYTLKSGLHFYQDKKREPQGFSHYLVTPVQPKWVIYLEVWTHKEKSGKSQGCNQPRWEIN